MSVEIDGAARHLQGRVLVEAQDGGLLLETPDRHLWTLQPDQIVSRQHNGDEFRYLNRSELKQKILSELPEGFRVHNTANYVICYNTSRAYAQWCGALFERLHRAFFNFWRRQGVRLVEPDVLVALAFRDKTSYVQYGRFELGDAAESIIGYYSLATNRITTYDLTGLEQSGGRADRASSTRRINQILSRPAAARTVATLIHEATHQLAFNSGLQTRFADNPLWLSEGLAIYFETPDLTSRRGWRGIGDLHVSRLQTMQDYLPRRPHDSLMTLLIDDARFRDPQHAETAYAEAWAVCFYLMRQKSDEFKDYLRQIGSKPVLGQDSAELRLKEFEEAMGQSWREIDADLLRSLPTWR